MPRLASEDLAFRRLRVKGVMMVMLQRWGGIGCVLGLPNMTGANNGMESKMEVTLKLEPFM